MWMLPLYLHVNQKSDYDDMLKGANCICLDKEFYESKAAFFMNRVKGFSLIEFRY